MISSLSARMAGPRYDLRKSGMPRARVWIKRALSKSHISSAESDSPSAVRRRRLRVALPREVLMLRHLFRRAVHDLRPSTARHIPASQNPLAVGEPLIGCDSVVSCGAAGNTSGTLESGRGPGEGVFPACP